MSLSNEDLEEFRNICRDRLALSLSREEAREEATTLLRLYELLIKPIPSERKDIPHHNE